MKNRLRQLAAAALATGALVLPGCMSVLQATSPDGPAVFGGIRLYGRVWASAFDDAAHPELGFRPLDLIFLTLDAPLSLAIDMVLWPISIPNEIAAGGIDPAPYPHPWMPPEQQSRAAAEALYRSGAATEKRHDIERRGEAPPPKAQPKQPKTEEPSKTDEQPPADAPKTDELPPPDAPKTDELPPPDAPKTDDLPPDAPKSDELPPDDEPPAGE